MNAAFRPRRQTAQLWGAAMALSLVTAAIILAVARVWPA